MIPHRHSPARSIRALFESVLPALAVCMLFAGAAVAAPVTLRVTVPSSTPASDLVYVAGDFQGWNAGSPAHALTHQPDGRWSITLDLTPGAAIQFKFTRGTWDNVEKGVNGEEIANHSLSPQAGSTYDYTVATWRDLGTLTGDIVSFTYAPFLGGRRCWVYLPPGYAANSAHYPVLYMHDGQNLFDVRTSFSGEWHVDEACESLIGAGEIEPLIVVGIENGGASRCFEYTPWSYAGQPCAGGGADVYLSAIRDVLIPYIDATYRTRTGRASRYLCGSSLGGLISAYAGYAYDDVFSRVAAVSPSYWWSNRQMVSFAQSHGRPNLTRFYQDMGTLEAGSLSDGNNNGIDDYIEDLRAMRDVALSQGFVPGTDFTSIEATGQTHNEFYWSQRFPNLLRFLAAPPLTGVAAPPTARAEVELSIAPNPMHEVSRIDFTLASDTHVRLDIVDLAGRHVGTLADREMPAGRQSVTWGRGADADRKITAGIYWIRLRAGTTSDSRMVVVTN